MAEFFSREKFRQAPRKEGGELLSVQNEWDDNTHTHAHKLMLLARRLFFFFGYSVPGTNYDCRRT